MGHQCPLSVKGLGGVTKMDIFQSLAVLPILAIFIF